VPFNIGISNIGAPRFHFRKDEMRVTYHLQVDIYSDDMSQKWFTMNLKDILLDFDMGVMDGNIML